MLENADVDHFPETHLILSSDHTFVMVIFRFFFLLFKIGVEQINGQALLVKQKPCIQL